MTSVEDVERTGRPLTSKRDEMGIAWRNMTSRIKEPPFVELLICWEFYFGKFKFGGLGSPRHNVTSHSTLSPRGILATNKITSCFSQNSIWHQREEDPILSPWFKQYCGAHLRISNNALQEMFRKLAQSLCSLYEVQRNLLRRGQHWLKSKCCYGEINSVRRP
jgi:hypothetical protein